MCACMFACMCLDDKPHTHAYARARAHTHTQRAQTPTRACIYVLYCDSKTRTHVAGAQFLRGSAGASHERHDKAVSELAKRRALPPETFDA